MKKSYSSEKINMLAKINEYVLQYKGHFHRIYKSSNNIVRVFSDLETYNQIMKKHTQQNLQSSKVFEIGYGARPMRLLAMTAMGIDAYGADLEYPLLQINLGNLYNIFKVNGIIRLLKSLIRYFIFDRAERKQLTRELNKRNFSFSIDKKRFLVNDILDVDLEDNSIDLIISEDVFEHIPVPTLENILPKMKRWSKPDGIVLIRPNIFTGITGGHIAEWSVFNTINDKLKRKSEPWEHLRKNRFKPLSYINQLKRSEYRILFNSHFKILDEIVFNSELGKNYMTSEIRQELIQYEDEELFSNHVLFVLRPIY